ncbi:MAG: hypothetical protein CMJ18_19965 [Phycisphaeraceae bacterium]|nr:hypothetical protein [Phycisphaeraceae bacterium]
MRIRMGVTVVLVACSAASAEAPPPQRAARNVKHQFLSADANRDGVVTAVEARGASWLDTERGRKRFQRVDLDGDGQISTEEARRHRRRVFQRRARQELSELRHLGDEHGVERLTDAAWLAQHPQIIERLATNEQFMQQHGQVIERLGRHERFVKNHPKLAQRIAEHRIRRHRRRTAQDDGAVGRSGRPVRARFEAHRERVQERVQERRDTVKERRHDRFEQRRDAARERRHDRFGQRRDRIGDRVQQRQDGARDRIGSRREKISQGRGGRLEQRRRETVNGGLNRRGRKTAESSARRRDG